MSDAILEPVRPVVSKKPPSSSCVSKRRWYDLEAWRIEREGLHQQQWQQSAWLRKLSVQRAYPVPPERLDDVEQEEVDYAAAVAGLKLKLAEHHRRGREWKEGLES